GLVGACPPGRFHARFRRGGQDVGADLGALVGVVVLVEPADHTDARLAGGAPHALVLREPGGALALAVAVAPAAGAAERRRHGGHHRRHHGGVRHAGAGVVLVLATKAAEPGV